MVAPLTVIDVGARWGVAERWSSLAPDLRVFGFDPDPDECARLNAQLAACADATTEYIPRALGPVVERRPLHLTAEPACSSLYPPIARLADTYRELECIAPTGRIDVELTTLDQWCDERQITVIDVMKVDTQGSELGVLQGAERILATAQVLEVEVEFNPIYEGQPLFGDVDAFLRGHGFVLWRIDNMVHYSTGPGAGEPVDGVAYFDSVPFARPGRGGQLYWGHAHFVRSELCPASTAPLDDEQRRRAGAVARAAGLGDLAAWLDHAGR